MTQNSTFYFSSIHYQTLQSSIRVRSIASFPLSNPILLSHVRWMAFLPAKGRSRRSATSGTEDRPPLPSIRTPRGESPLRQIRSRLISNEAATAECVVVMAGPKPQSERRLIRAASRLPPSLRRPSEDVLKYQPIKFGWNGGCERASTHD